MFINQQSENPNNERILTLTTYLHQTSTTKF